MRKARRPTVSDQVFRDWFHEHRGKLSPECVMKLFVAWLDVLGLERREQELRADLAARPPDEPTLGLDHASWPADPREGELRRIVYLLDRARLAEAGRRSELARAEGRRAKDEARRAAVIRRLRALLAKDPRTTSEQARRLIQVRDAKTGKLKHIPERTMRRYMAEARPRRRRGR